ncbi:MAG: hypothetical protein P8P90_07785 [Opitutales bacterium]|nr:hypothetical protein [Opitutales bacterium]MDG1356133.1 hypothetical protein [Opitutales bacterium]
MKVFIILSTIALTFAWGCSEDRKMGGNSGGGHVHQAMRGGILMELGPHGSGHNLELLLNNKGEFEIFILDAHAENYVRIEQSTIELNLADNNRTITLNAIPDPATGETVGNSSLFRTSQSVENLLPIKAEMVNVAIGSSNYLNTPLSFSGNPKSDNHEH